MRTAPTFDDLLAPSTREAFFRTCFERTPHHGKGAPDRFAAVLPPGEWMHAAATSRHVHASHVDDGGQQHSTDIPGSEVAARFAAGQTICADVSHVPGVAALLAMFRESLHLVGGPCLAKLYASPNGGGFTMHSDAFHVFVLQLAGTKRWHVSRTPNAPAPLTGWVIDRDGRPSLELPRNFDPALLEHVNAVSPPSDDDMTTIDLGPGDCLYVPAGAWHRAEALGESVAVSISPPRTTAIRVMLGALERALLADPDWRRDLLVTDATLGAPGEIPRAMAERLDALRADLSARLGAVDPRWLHRIWRATVERDRALFDGVAARPPTAPVERSDELVRTGDVRFLRAPSDHDDSDALFLYARGTEWSFPSLAERWLTALARHDAFAAGDSLAWDPALGWDAVRELLASLLEAGLVSRRAAEGRPRSR